MITLSEFNDDIPPPGIAVVVLGFIVLGFIVTASRELGGISVMIKEVKDDVSELKEEICGIKADLNLFKFGSAFIFALGIGGALAQYYQASGS